MNHQQNEEPLVSETESQYEVQVVFKLVILLPQPLCAGVCHHVQFQSEELVTFSYKNCSI